MKEMKKMFAMVLIVLVAGSVNAATLKHYWSFDDAPSSTAAVDSVGGNAILLNEATFVAGQIGGAIRTNYAKLASTPLGDEPTQGFTMAFWVKAIDFPASNRFNAAVGVQQPGYGMEAEVDMGPDTMLQVLTVERAGDGGIGKTYAIANAPKGQYEIPGDFIHVVMTGDGVEQDADHPIRLWVNGVEQVLSGNATAQVSGWESGHEMHIGYNTPWEPLTMDIVVDDLRLYDGVLTQNEIDLLFLAGIRGQARKPISPDGTADVDPAAVTALTWTSPDVPDDPNVLAVNYDVYIMAIPTDDVTADDPNFLTVTPVAAATEMTPVALTTDMTYFWRVDSNITWDSDKVTGSTISTVEGPVWSFKTIPADFAPEVNAGPDILTALEFDAAVVSGTVNDFGEGDLQAGDVVWSIVDAPEGASPVLVQEGTLLAPVAKLTADIAGDYQLQLTATDANGPISDTVVVTVAADACAAAKANGTSVNLLDVSPAGGDCVVDLNDFAVFVAQWLDNRNLTEQVDR